MILNVKLEDIDTEEVNAKIQAQKELFLFYKQFDPQTGIYYLVKLRMLNMFLF